MGCAAHVAGTVSGLWFGFGGEPASARLLRFRHPGCSGGLRCGFQSRGCAFAPTTGLRLPGPFVPNPFRAAPCKAEYEEGRFVGQAGDNTELQGDRSKVAGAPQSGVGHRIPSRCPLGSPPDSCRRVLLGGFLGVDTIIFAMPYARREQLAHMVSVASESFRSVLIVPNLEGVTTSAVTPRDFAGTLAIEIKHNLLDPWSQRLKRALDLLGTVIGGVLVSPLVFAIAVVIKLDSPGPAFYGHQRVGAGGKHFLCWKFRTMHVNAERLLDQYLQGSPVLRAEWEQNQKLRDDPRVTRVGGLLRQTSLDELPQLWNVLRAEMSLTGPRPIVDAEVPKYGKVYALYQRIRPGMSGIWQVSGRSDTSYADRVEMDSYYVRNWSVWLDLVILARTVRCVALGRGAR